MNYFSNGKLLITGEYVVLDGALSLAVPTTFGQSLIVEPIQDSKLIWKSLDYEGNAWFENEFSFEQIATSLSITIETHSNDNPILERLIQILKAAKKLNPEFLNTNEGFKITTKLDFPRDWGLGTSSSLINNIAHWTNVDAYKLLELTFGGSGYDIACAQYDSAITYQLELPFDPVYPEPCRRAQGDISMGRIINPVNFDPIFKEHLYFVYLNKKQNSREGIADYKLNATNLSVAISEINDITTQIIACKSLIEFERLMTQHEHIISKIIKQTPIKERLFNDFEGAIKSLGAWGGDFVLVASQESPKAYFESKGFNTVIAYKDMVLN